MDRKLEDLTGKNIIVYDLEIKKRIADCLKGWDSHDEMGISVGCMFDYREMKFRVFMDDNINELTKRMNEDGTLIVAFNHVGFDNKLMRASGHKLKEDNDLNNYDMMLISKNGSGCEGQYVKGFKLDDHLKACGLPLKTANGEMAPIWWQQGKIGSVVDYCLSDVTQEKALFEYMYINGKVASAYKKEFYEIDLPNFK